MTPPTDTHRNKALVRAFWQAMWTADPAGALAPIVTADVAFRGTLGVEAKGPEGVAGYVAAVTRAFPDYHAAIEELIAEGDRVVARMRFSGTHAGEVLGRRATGRKVEYLGLALARVTGGRIGEMWVVGDTIGLAAQIEAS
jgi:predicted ester cyclase